MSLFRKGQSDVKRHISSLNRKHIHIELGRSVAEPDAKVAYEDGNANTESDAAWLARRFAENIFPAIVPTHAEGQEPSAVLPKLRA